MLGAVVGAPVDDVGRTVLLVGLGEEADVRAIPEAEILGPVDVRQTVNQRKSPPALSR